MEKEGIEEIVEEKNEFETLDAAFQSDEIEDELEEEKVLETDEKPKEEVDESKETPEKEEPEEKPAESEEEPTGKTWAEHGLEQFDGKSTAEIAEIIKQKELEHTNWKDKKYGEQANELGELRKFKEAVEAAKKEAELDSQKEDAKADLLESIPDLTQKEIDDFNTLYEVNPAKAIMKITQKHLEALVDGRLQKSLPKTVDDVVGKSIEQQKDDLQYDSFLLRHQEDAEQQIPLMQSLAQKEHLGGQRRSYEELYQLAKLGNSKDALYQPVYQFMKKYDMPFDDALKFAKQQTSSAADDKAKKIKETVAKIDKTNNPAKTEKVADKTKKFSTVDDAFEEPTSDED